MEIAINAYSAKAGGGKTYLYNLLRNIPSEVSQIYLFCHDDLDVGMSPKIKRVKTVFPVYNPVFRGFWERFVLPVWLRQKKVKTLFVPGGVVNTKPPPGCRVVTMFRNMLPFNEEGLRESGSSFLRLKNWKLKRMMLHSMQTADLVIFISNFALQYMEKLIKVRRSAIIPHGLAEAFLTADKSLDRPPLPFLGRYFLYVSRFDFYKRHLQVIKAYESLPTPIKDEYRLVLAGDAENSFGREALLYLKNKGLEGRVTVLGDYDYLKLPALYSHSELFIFASTCENCPNILLEAMGGGVPIICSDYQPMPEFGGDALIYASPDEPHQISEAILRVVSQPALREVLAEKAAAQSRKFSWDRTAAETWKVILSV
ncbi:glycosyltransferase [compost metagenome]